MERAGGRIRKRKADNQDSSERLSKRLNLLNLERNGEKLYVAVENPSRPTTPPTIPSIQASNLRQPDDDVMQLDDTKHKVYIYNIDDELSDSDSSVDENKLVFLSDIDKHLRQNRIPPAVLANNDGELAGRNLNTELVLYKVPNSLTVSEDKDIVRKAIIESRARAQAKQRRDREAARTAPSNLSTLDTEKSQGNGLPVINALARDAIADEPMDDDPDAMDLS